MKINKSGQLWRVLIMFSILTAHGKLSAQETLGQFPLCEASAVLLINSPSEDNAKCLLVGDNEQGKELYLFTIDGDKLVPTPQSAFDLSGPAKEDISDIEALANLDGEIAAFASHSRNSRCEVKKKRKQFAKIGVNDKTTAVVDTLKSRTVTCDTLFAGQTRDASIQAVCDAIDTADAEATRVQAELGAGKISNAEAEARCNAINAFNAEGAVGFRTDHRNEVWIGLRAPLLPTHPDRPDKKNLAILLHMKDLTAYTFDRVAFVDLGGRGIRELSADGEFIWIIAGPPEDRSEPFQLRRMAKSALEEPDVIDAKLIKELPNSSEGLAVVNNTAYVVIDGDTGKSSCKLPATYEVLSLD